MRITQAKKIPRNSNFPQCDNVSESKYNVSRKMTWNIRKGFFLSELYSESLSSIIYANATANHIWNEKQLQTRERGDTNTFDIRMTTVDAL